MPPHVKAVARHKTDRGMVDLLETHVMTPAAPQTVDAVVLLGWMQKEMAVEYLRTQCVFNPPLNDEMAADIWARYKEAVVAIGIRPVGLPARLDMNDYERRSADAFLNVFKHQLRIPSIQEVIKIDPRSLVVHQFYVVTQQSDGYANDVCTAAGWAKHCLPTTPPPPKSVKIYSGLNTINIEVPHGEFFFTHNAQTGQFQIQEYLRHVAVSQFAAQERMLLWAGYHRSYARMASTVPDAMVRSALMVLTTDGVLHTSPGAQDQGLRAILCGDTPPLFADFLDDRLVMKVKLRKKRFELHVRAAIAAIDA
jgi:hypothetical protein